MSQDKIPPLLSMLQRLPPSKELLDFYHKKLEQYVDEESKWLKRLANTKKAVDKSRVLEKELFGQKREITALQKAVTDMREALNQERKINNKLYVDNDKLRIKELEDRRKVVALLELCGKSDHEVTKLIDAAQKRGDYGGDAFVPQRIQDYMDKAKSDPSKFASMKSTAESARLEILALENQLMEQEKCHLEQLSMMENERRLNARDREAERVQYEARIAELSNHIQVMEENHEAAGRDLIKCKSDFRKEERNWMAEKEFLMRKLQFVQQYGSVVAPSVDGGYYTDQRSTLRKGGDLKAQRELQRLNSELADQKKVTDDYRSRLLALESETENLRDASNASKEIFRGRTKAMVNQVDNLKERYENLDKRRKNEADGYQADIQILRQKLRSVEQQLVRATVAKAKEHEFIKKLRHYEAEISRLRRNAKANPVWQS